VFEASGFPSGAADRIPCRIEDTAHRTGQVARSTCGFWRAQLSQRNFTLSADAAGVYYTKVYCTKVKYTNHSCLLLISSPWGSNMHFSRIKGRSLARSATATIWKGAQTVTGSRPAANHRMYYFDFRPSCRLLTGSSTVCRLNNAFGESPFLRGNGPRTSPAKSTPVITTKPSK